jgi:hypothetical protein
MRCTIAFMLGLLLAFAGAPHLKGAGEGCTGDACFNTGKAPPPVSTPQPLWDAWLRFHEAQWCEGLDTIFVFHVNGMEVWCRIEDEKAYDRFSELIKPLRSEFQIALYPTRPMHEKKAPDEKGPPPSLWNNSELRAYLQDPFSRSPVSGAETPRPPSLHSPDSDFMFKQRLMMFADQTLDWERKLDRYAGDLPALCEAAFAAEMPQRVRPRAAAACLAHLQQVDKYAERLSENMAEALPKAGKKASDSSEGSKPEQPPASPLAASFLIADAAHNIAGRIERFIYPTHYTVGLSDLREPSLLEELKRLRNLVAAFQRLLNP